MRNAELRRNIENAGAEAQYDAQAKKLLSHKIVLAWIMHSCLEEYKEIEPEVIAEKYIEHTQVGAAGVLPGDTGELIRGMGAEDVTPREQRITFDILFRAIALKNDEWLELILNVEAQNRYYPGYPLETRGIYYCSRMLSSQYGREFQNSEYEKLKKVYSIWVCTNPPKEFQNSIATYKIKEYLDIGGRPRDKRNYDLLATVMIGLGKPGQENYDGICRFLGTLLSDKIQPEKKEEILQEEFNIRMSKEMRKDVEIMCNLSQEILQQGRAEGFEQGREEGKKEMALGLHEMGMSVSQIARVAKVSEEQIHAWILEEK